MRFKGKGNIDKDCVSEMQVFNTPHILMQKLSKLDKKIRKLLGFEVSKIAFIGVVILNI